MLDTPVVHSHRLRRITIVISHGTIRRFWVSMRIRVRNEHVPVVFCTLLITIESVRASSLTTANSIGVMVGVPSVLDIAGVEIRASRRWQSVA